jgi:hypothetical protein
MLNRAGVDYCALTISTQEEVCSVTKQTRGIWLKTLKERGIGCVAAFLTAPHRCSTLEKSGALARTTQLQQRFSYSNISAEVPSRIAALTASGTISSVEQRLIRLPDSRAVCARQKMAISEKVATLSMARPTPSFEIPSSDVHSHAKAGGDPECGVLAQKL